MYNWSFWNLILVFVTLVKKTIVRYPRSRNVSQMSDGPAMQPQWQLQRRLLVNIIVKAKHVDSLIIPLLRRLKAPEELYRTPFNTTFEGGYKTLRSANEDDVDRQPVFLSRQSSSMLPVLDLFSCLFGEDARKRGLSALRRNENEKMW